MRRYLTLVLLLVSAPVVAQTVPLKGFHPDRKLCPLSSTGLRGQDPKPACDQKLPPATDVFVPGIVLGDSTDVSGEPRDVPHWRDLDIEAPYLFTATGQGIEIYDVTDPTRRDWLAFGDASEAAPLWGASDKDFFLKSISVPDGNPHLAATGAEEFGFILWNTADPSAPAVHYQDAGGRFVTQVYANRLSNGRDVAFAVDTTSSGGLLAYDLSRAQERRLHRCHDDSSNGQTWCGVYLGQLAPLGDAGNGAALAGVDDFVAFRGTRSRVDVFRVDPGSPASSPIVHSVSLPATGLGGLAMWHEDQTYYLAALGIAVEGALLVSKLWIYDVSCVTGATCRGLVAEYTVPNEANAFQLNLTFSRNFETPFLHVGNDARGLTCPSQREYLLDLSVFGATPPDPAPSLAEIDVAPEGYWSWYYEPCFNVALSASACIPDSWELPSSDPCPGFNNMQPQRGRFHQGYFFRVGNTLLDTHCYRAQGVTCGGEPPPPPPPPPPPNDRAPVAAFTWLPAEPRVDSWVLFLDLSTGGTPDTWEWNFDPDAEIESFSRDAIWIFATGGRHTVRLRVANDDGASETEHPVNVFGPSTGDDLVFEDGFESGDLSSWAGARSPAP